MKPKHLKSGDKVAIVSLSSGVLGESFVKHEIDIAEKRLKEYGLIPVYMPNSLKGIDYLKNNPDKRAEDLKTAFLDKDIKGIICAIGGDDTYRLTPYLLGDEQFAKAVKDNPKLFAGFSDSTINHLVLNKLGLNTFYGPNYLCDLAELDKEMLPYTKDWFETYLGKDKREIEPSDTWYYDRKSYGVDAVGTPRESVKETKGYETILGSGAREGKLFGGCIDVIHSFMFDKTRKEFNDKYKVFPTKEDLSGKIIFLETSEVKPTPEELRTILLDFKKYGAFDKASGIIFGKPCDGVYYDEYKDVLREVLKDTKVPVLYNVNFGHSVPRCVIPYNIECKVDYDNKTITLLESMFED